ncbi:aminotransferase class V-fold PLP-dependent enzyme [Geomicrobium sp. JCM 19037]|uniref:aminotransferase class V-fold PLP-dependent enzyme n=1 Tax=Geomicrobium sp. JCM 19037 TaxID=1460634 RepID=UPI0005AAE8E8|nr:aminotransferase class V-fold PLP-dependent enzyme [Geomicrobium sp. JCM 19037]
MSSILRTLSIEEAKDMQFRLVETMSRHFNGETIFQGGDRGVHPKFKRPKTTVQVESMLADFFQSQSAALVRGSGTGAIRTILAALLNPGDTIFVHDAPMYTTTKETFRMLGFHAVVVDFHDTEKLKTVLRNQEAQLFYIQHARQQPEDTYDLERVIQTVREVSPNLPIVTDDNYCSLKVPAIGVELGADYSTFSGFKVLGPEGIGVIVGKREGIDVVHERNYSGGGQVQGPEALDLMRMMTFAPVSLAVQNEQVEALHKQLNDGVIPEVRAAYMTNAQSKNVIIELKAPVAKRVIERSGVHGAAVYPVGAESRYEILPMIYRVSGSFIASHPELADYGLRINPMKSHAQHILDILRRALDDVQEE